MIRKSRRWPRALIIILCVVCVTQTLLIWFFLKESGEKTDAKTLQLRLPKPVLAERLNSSSQPPLPTQLSTSFSGPLSTAAPTPFTTSAVPLEPQSTSTSPSSSHATSHHSDLMSSFSFTQFCSMVNSSDARIHEDTAWKRFDSISSGNGNVTHKRVKARFLVFHSTEKSPKDFFALVASARLSGVLLEMISVKERNPVPKLSLLLEYIQLEKLEEEDVVVVLDSSSIFTGKDFYPVLEDYIANSPSGPKELHAWNVRQHKKKAPLLFGASPQYFPTTDAHGALMQKQYHDALNALRYWSQKHDDKQLNIFETRNPNIFVSSAFLMGRVWALKMLPESVRVVQNFFMPSLGNHWLSEQSVFTSLFNRLRYAEVRNDLLTPSGELKVVKPFSLFAGMLDLDYRNVFFAEYHPTRAELTLQSDDKKFSTNRSFKFSREKLFDLLQTENSTYLTQTAVGAPMAAASLSYSPRPSVFNSSRISLFAIPSSDGTPPAVWHLSELHHQKIDEILNLMPISIVLEAFPERRKESYSVMASAPQERVWGASLSWKDDKLISANLTLTGEFNMQKMCEDFESKG